MSGTMGWVALVGGLILAAVLLFGMLSNRRRAHGDKLRTEDATRDLYARTDAQDKASDPDVR